MGVPLAETAKVVVSRAVSFQAAVMIYQEGIYVGYKYYETRYEDQVMGTGNAGSARSLCPPRCRCW